MHALAERAADMRARTIAGLRAKAAILWSAEFSFIDPAEIRKAGPHEWLAYSIVYDLIGERAPR